MVEEDPLKVYVLDPPIDKIPYDVLGSGKIVFNRIHAYNFNSNGFYVLDIDKKTANGFRFSSQATQPSISPDGTRIASSFLLNSVGSSNGWDIYLMNIDGSNCYPIFQSTGMSEFPSWTTDGSKILFYVYGNESPLYIQSPVLNPTDRKELIKFSYSNDPGWMINPLGGFSISPQGLVIFGGCAGDLCGILRIDPYRGKNGVSRLLPFSDSEGVSNPVFSPDGLQIAFMTSGVDSLSTWVGVKIMNTDATNINSLCRVRTYKYPVQYMGVHRSISICWSPDGTKILFTAPLEEYGYHLFVINTDGTGLTQVTDDVKACDLDVSWSR